MDTVYYRKLMKNGAVASKFKIEYRHSASYKSSSNEHKNPIQKPDGLPLELSTTHHDSNCARCYKLKKKCSRAYPSCEYCLRSNASCEYIDRRKRRLRFEEISNMGSTGANTSASIISAMTGINTTTASGSAEASIASDSAGSGRVGLSENDSLADISDQLHDSEPSRHNSIASLVNHEEGESFRNIDPLAAHSTSDNENVLSGPVSRTHSRMSLAAASRAKPAVSVSRNFISSSITENTESLPNLNDEFLAVKPIANPGLPSQFVHTFFANYEWKYPFFSRDGFFKKFENLSFATETLVGLDVYLVMAIGCLIQDACCNTHHYSEYFSDTFVESIVDMISYDIKSEDDLHKAHVLVLLSIYAVQVGNTNLVWNIVGFLDRLVMFLTDFTGKNTRPSMHKRCFWTIFNLDKELSLSLDKPSQFIPTKIIKMSSDFNDTLVTGESHKSAAFMAHSVKLHMLQDQILSHRLGLEPVTTDVLSQFSADLEAWRVGSSSLIHTEYAESSLLQNFIGLVNLDYYYLLIELDQLSPTQSSQSTLQFLSNSFSLLLSEVSDKKESGGTSVYSLFWFLKFFKVVDYSVASLLKILDADESKTNLMMRLNDLNGNVQLEINLLKFLLNSESRPKRFVDKLDLYLQRLKTLNQKLVCFNPLSGHDKNAQALAREISQLFKVQQE